jgi:amino acid transporter
MNKTIGSGIFTQPYNVVSGVGNPAAALLLWIGAALIAWCIAICWVELGLSIPRHKVAHRYVSTPKSGGDKNYVCRSCSVLSAVANI